MRPTFDEIFMQAARLFGTRGTCPRGQHGAIITIDNRIVSAGYTGSAPGDPHCDDVGCEIDPATGGCIRTQHAEMNAVTFASRHGVSLVGGTLYITLQPCLPCAKVLVACGIMRVVMDKLYRDPRGLEWLRGHGVKCDLWEQKPSISTPTEQP